MQMPIQNFAKAQPFGPETTPGAASWLAGHALEPNFTLDPDWTGPMVAACARAGQVELVHTLAADGRPGGHAVVERKSWRWGLPLVHAQSWFGDFPISGTPLINRDDPAGNCARLVETIFDRTGAHALLLSHVTGHHVVSSVLVDACAAIGAPIRFLDDRKRAALRCNGDFEAWFEETFARKRRKELRRLKSRLAETGELVVEVRTGGELGLAQWIDSFIALEQSGWKGEAGTAIGQSHALTQFVRTSLAGLNAAGKLMTWSIKLDGKPVAMMFGVRNGATASIVKMAHDESLNRFSPGQLLILEATRTLFDDDGIMFADSCAAPGHPMIDHLWKDRLEVRDVLIGNPGRSAPVFALIHGLEQVRRSLFRHLKTLRHFLKKAKR